MYCQMYTYVCLHGYFDIYLKIQISTLSFFLLWQSIAAQKAQNPKQKLSSPWRLAFTCNDCVCSYICVKWLKMSLYLSFKGKCECVRRDTRSPPGINSLRPGYFSYRQLLLAAEFHHLGAKRLVWWIWKQLDLAGCSVCLCRPASLLHCPERKKDVGIIFNKNNNEVMVLKWKRCHSAFFSV